MQGFHTELSFLGLRDVHGKMTLCVQIRTVLSSIYAAALQPAKPAKRLATAVASQSPSKQPPIDLCVLKFPAPEHDATSKRLLQE